MKYRSLRLFYSFGGPGEAWKEGDMYVWSRTFELGKEWMG